MISSNCFEFCKVIHGKTSVYMGMKRSQVEKFPLFSCEYVNNKKEI